MRREFEKLRLAALNIDGVLLNDTFSPVIHHFVVSRGGAYTAETERAIFSQPQHIAGQRMAEAVGGTMSGEEALAAYFEERDRHVARHPVVVADGAVELLRLLRSLGLRTVCYGGLPKAHFDHFLGAHAELFDGPGYVCTNDFRPGVHEITTDVFQLKSDQAVFVDDVARVAEAAKDLGTPFIGLPSPFEHGFQRQLMGEAGVRHVVDRLDRIDEDLLRLVDARAATGDAWGE
ncbi:HAD family phosphatase [Streptomyces sp. AK08-02]|uniref:HAD family phosphatase n=1 Tax=Streptomyces sp. AK08-02 TaxID=3028654 RepID=UPI0029A904D9|nr:HAD family phosphatase [Streptomyces sp. AK08-02]MDX3747948.1 HAD family phosphatase [Streptomyces sp. AK08-02]